MWCVDESNNKKKIQTKKRESLIAQRTHTHIYVPLTLSTQIVNVNEIMMVPETIRFSLNSHKRARSTKCTH